MGLEDRLLHISLFLALTLLFVSATFYYLIKKKPSLDSPISFSLLLYFMYFFLSPVFDIVSNTTSMAETPLLSYYPFTQFVFLCAILSFILSYELFNIPVLNITPTLKTKALIINASLWELTGLAGYFLWTRKLGISFFVINPLKLSNFYLMLGETSRKVSGYLALSLLFLIPSSLMFLELKIRKALRNLPILILIINLILFLTRGVRYIILIYGGSIILYYLRRTEKTLKKFHIIALFVSALFVFSIIAYLRGAPSLSSLSLNTEFIMAFFTSSFSLFKPTAAIMRYIPHHHPFLLGESFLYTLILPIPRVIWPQKPYPEFLKILWKITGGRFFGYAVPNIGEYYANFGIPGVIVFMALLALIFKTAYITYRKYRKNEFVLMSYSIFLFYIFQIISRGYFPQIFVQGIYLFLPLVSLYLLNLQNSRK